MAKRQNMVGFIAFLQKTALRSGSKSALPFDETAFGSSYRFLGHVTWCLAVDRFRSITMRDALSAPIIVAATVVQSRGCRRP
jgi:hypothetical protein